ncbi:MAG: hypothetical protein ACP5PQ_05715 [Thermoproteota archaeon]
MPYMALAAIILVAGLLVYSLKKKHALIAERSVPEPQAKSTTRRGSLLYVGGTYLTTSSEGSFTKSLGKRALNVWA